MLLTCWFLSEREQHLHFRTECKCREMKTQCPKQKWELQPDSPIYKLLVLRTFEFYVGRRLTQSGTLDARMLDLRV